MRHAKVELPTPDEYGEWLDPNRRWAVWHTAGHIEYFCRDKLGADEARAFGLALIAASYQTPG